jgi:hypothetical protein
VDSAAFVQWDSVASAAWRPIWERALSEDHSLVESFTVDGLADITNRYEELGGRRASAREREEVTEIALNVLATALTLALLRNGWTVNADPGAAVVCTRDTDSIEPFGVVTALSDGTLAPDDWRRRCTELRISDLPLADPSWPPESQDARRNEPALPVPAPPGQPK